MKLKSIIPNIITSLNLLCGCSAVIAFLNEDNVCGVFLILASLILDFLDGFVARLLQIHSELGKQLDSLADLISFGMVPGIIIYVALRNCDSINTEYSLQALIPYLGFLITIFSAIRLAKFNIDCQQATSFVGLPTPASTLFFLSIPLILEFSAPNSIEIQAIHNPFVLIGVTLLFSYLLVANLPLLSFKCTNCTWTDNKAKYILLISSCFLLVIFSFLAPVFIILLYIIISIINNKSKAQDEIHSRN